MNVTFLYLFIILIRLTFMTSMDIDVHINFDNYSNLIVDVSEFYNLRRIYTVYDDFSNCQITLANLKSLSEKGLPSQILTISSLENDYNNIFIKYSRQLFVLYIRKKSDFIRFENFTNFHNLAFHNWLIIFASNDTADICENHSINYLRLNFDFQILVKCCGSSKIQEWYIPKGQDRIEAYDFLEWNLESGLVVKSNRNIYRRRRDFRRAQLKIAVVKEREDSPYMDKDKQLKNLDNCNKVIVELINAMNFSIALMPPTNYYGKFNETEKKWTGLLHEILEGRVDISLTEFTVISERLIDFDYTIPLFSSQNVLHFQDPETLGIQWNGYMKCFAIEVLFTLGALMILMTIILTWFKFKTTGHVDFVENFIKVWGIYCQQGITDISYHSAWKIAIFFIFVSQLIILANYNAFLISYLSTMTYKLPFYTVKEFIEDGSYEFIVNKNSGEEIYFLHTQDPLMQKIKEVMRPHALLPANNRESYKQVCNNKKLALFNIASKLEKIKIPKTCKIASVPAIGKRYMALPLAKHSPLKGYFNHYILRMKETGILKRFLNSELERDKIQESVIEPVNLQEVTSVLLILFTGFSISIIVLLIENIHCKMKSRKN